MLAMVAYSRRSQSGHITCYFNRTFDVLPTHIDCPRMSFRPTGNFSFLRKILSRFSPTSLGGGPLVQVQELALVSEGAKTPSEFGVCLAFSLPASLARFFPPGKTCDA